VAVGVEMGKTSHRGTGYQLHDVWGNVHGPCYSGG
jgi:hypothetical protein